MAIEIECKIKVDSHQPVRARLQAIAAQPAGTVVEINRMFDLPSGALRAEGRGLRLREYRDPDSASRSHRSATLTYKGPPYIGAFKSRDEIELAVPDPAAAARLLHALGYVETLVFEKRRESWMFGDCHVELDELPYIGFFVEVEGTEEAAVKETLAAIGLDAVEPMRKTYAALLSEHCRAKGLSAGDLRLH